MLGIAPAVLQDLALYFVELHEICMGPSLKPVTVPLDGVPSLQHVNHTTQLGAVDKTCWGCTSSPYPCCQEQCWSQYLLWKNILLDIFIGDNGFILESLLQHCYIRKWEKFLTISPITQWTKESNQLIQLTNQLTSRRKSIIISCLNLITISKPERSWRTK